MHLHDLRIFTEPQQGATYDDILGAAPSTDELDNFFGGLKGLLDDT